MGDKSVGVSSSEDVAVLLNVANGVDRDAIRRLQNRVSRVFGENLEIESLRQRVVVEEDIHFKEYKDVVFNKTSLSMEQSSIRSYRHQLYTINQMKNALNGIDTKQYILDDGINSLALGHYKIPQ